MDSAKTNLVCLISFHFRSSNVGKDGKKEKKRMDAITVAFGTALEDMKDQVGDRLSWREFIYVVTKS